ncbi:3-phenylpropionate/trans-cinnamate dioxygenase ferredoxin reductase subunit [Spinactinospora alkalitolerans]|uniref:3-phenylpropionate/trans-cinnamate dioxygenase ferredoxin reductase subunit n=1 Tax=Spinactinospora alkalitolerans TaxID=687207 RepID=A0A852TZK5_9ACTN|nr:FAD-dependent oxidoreductase [Spinactinospora alkalitolerans]NYE49358.1 3-phenylpropionate/trans-cinnamate dioxygenase ferredoxin reductase subunit [Spinactinospora alkalitolerans]
MRDIVIVGAGMAGLGAAESLRSAGFDGTITLVGEEKHRPYSRPPLSKEVLTGRGSPKGVALRDEPEFDALRLDLRLGRRAERLRPAERAVELDDGSALTCDGLVIATGAAPRRPATGLAGVHVLRTIEDAEAVRAELEAVDRMVVVGAGFIGAEVAASARALGVEVTLVEAAPTPMTRVVDPRIGAALTGLHLDHGVDLRLGVGVTGFEGTGRVERVRLADGTAVEASLVVAGLGVETNTGWLAGSGVELAGGVGGVRCDAHCATSLPGVYAAGDIASWPHPRYGGRIRLEHWTNAGEQAAVAAHNLLAGEGARQEYAPVPYFWSDQYGMKVQLLGQAAPADTVEFVHGSVEDRKFVAFLGRAGMLVGVLGLRSTPKVMRYRPLLAEPTAWDDALAAAGR